jgi:hypothetical protein
MGTIICTNGSIIRKMKGKEDKEAHHSRDLTDQFSRRLWTLNLVGRLWLLVNVLVGLGRYIST